MPDHANQNTEARPDPLGFDHYADALAARIDAALRPDEPSDDPLVVGIFGEWGSGKSHLLQLLVGKYQAAARQKLDAVRSSAHISAPDALELTLPVHFNPWKYEHEPHLLVPLIHHIRFAIEEAMQRLGDTPSGQVVGGVRAAASLATKLARALVSGIKLEFNLGVAKVAADGGKMMDTAAAPDAAKEATPPLTTEYESIYFQCHDYLRRLVRPAGGLKLNFVVFVDDLDRCLPEKAVNVLELVKTFLNLGAFAFVVALDDEIIERGIHHRYRKYRFVGREDEAPITGREYLEKIIHLPFRLPPLRRQQAQSLLADRIKRLGEDSATLYRMLFEVLESPAEGRTERKDAEDKNPQPATEAERRTAHDDTRLIDWMLDITPWVPRKLIRLQEIFLFARQVLVGRRHAVAVGQIDPRILLAVCWVQLFAPELYRRIRQQPDTFALLAEWCEQKGDRLSDGDIDGIVKAHAQDWIPSPLGDAPAESTDFVYLHVKKPLADILKHFRKQRGGCESLLRLFQKLKPLLGSAFDSRILAPYLEWDKVAALDAPQATTPDALSRSGAGRIVRISDMQRFVDYLFSDSATSRREALALLGLGLGDVVDTDDAWRFAQAAKFWLASGPIGTESARVVEGLRLLAPYLEPHALEHIYETTNLLGHILRNRETQP